MLLTVGQPFGRFAGLLRCEHYYCHSTMAAIQEPNWSGCYLIVNVFTSRMDQKNSTQNVKNQPKSSGDLL